MKSNLKVFLDGDLKNRSVTSVCWTLGLETTAFWFSPAFCSFAVE